MILLDEPARKLCGAARVKPAQPRFGVARTTAPALGEQRLAA